MIDGVIFDVDGTLWDSTPVVEEAWNAALLEVGIHDVRVSADQLKGLFGLPMDDIIDSILPGREQAVKDRYKPICYRNEHDYLQKCPGNVYPDFLNVLKVLSKKYPLFIVSNCQAGYIELFLEKTGFGPYFKDHVCPGDTNLLKADNIKLIVEKHGLKAPVYIGDTQMDANACKDAGVRMIFAEYGFGSVEHPDAVINSPSEIEKVLEQL